MSRSLLALGAVLVALLALSRPNDERPQQGDDARGRYSIRLRVDLGDRTPSHAVAAVPIDFAALLREAGESGRFDATTLELIGLDAAGQPLVFDATQQAAARQRIPWRLERLYPGSRGTLSFVVKGRDVASVAVFFDTADSGNGNPRRYRGLVGDGDGFALEYGRRETAASGYDAFADFDGDGDLDLLQGGTDSTIRYLENIGSGRLEDRGLLTSAGAKLDLPQDRGSRSWVSVAACDWDADADVDLLLHFRAGPQRHKVVRYENLGAASGELTFADRGPIPTASGGVVSGPVSCVDWDGDGRLDLLASADAGRILFHRNLGQSRAVAEMQLADGVPLQANGHTIRFRLPRVDAADIDADGDLDLFVGTDDGRVFLFENRGSRREPRLATGEVIVFHGYLDARTGVRIFDWDADGRLDLLVGRYWHRTSDGDQPVVHGRLYRNVGTRERPRFEERDAASGAPYEEGFLPVDALRQNAARVADWDEDGVPDLVVGDTDGYVWLFRGAGGGPFFPLFAAGRRLRAAGEPIRVYGEQREGRRAGYASPDVVDWDGDGRRDLLVADGRGFVTFFRNEGRAGAPALAAGRRLEANGRPIDGTGRGSVRAVDWDEDGRLDLLFSMTGGDLSRHYDWPHRDVDPSRDRGLLVYPNTGGAGEPSLGAPFWVRSGRRGGRAIDFERPNLGDLVDWDGDGRRDLIVAEFEHYVRLYRNVGPGPGAPDFSGPRRGEVLFTAPTRQLISGAQAIDWDGDGDLDLVTGQGHGGSGALFFSREYLEDLLAQTPPIVQREAGVRHGSRDAFQP